MGLIACKSIRNYPPTATPTVSFAGVRNAYVFLPMLTSVRISERARQLHSIDFEIDSDTHTVNLRGCPTAGRADGMIYLAATVLIDLDELISLAERHCKLGISISQRFCHSDMDAAG